MVIWIREILMVSLLITFSLQLVGGNGSSCGGLFKCCSGYKWDRYTEKCFPCEVGYYGENCTEPSPFPSFGEECQLFCNCSEDQCNHEKGCPKGGPGYIGAFCDVKYRYPGFGRECQDTYLFEQEMCHPVKGCQASLEDIFVEVATIAAPKSRTTLIISKSLIPDADVNRSFSLRDTSSFLSTIPDVSDCLKETSIQSDAASMWKTLNEKEIGMVISITTLGLLSLILTVMYIWVSHRLRVETNNRRDATDDFDENSGA